MFIKERPEGARVARIEPAERAFVALLTVPILLLGMSPLIGKLSEAAERVARDTMHSGRPTTQSDVPKMPVSDQAPVSDKTPAAD
jgi:hypothetical protein